MPASSPLGDFLRWHRARLTPENVGLRVHGQRRVPGLRREEVALLARISTEYYVRLEQGRERSPSVAVLDALADVLNMDGAHASHLHALARPRAPRRDGTHDDVPVGTLRLLESLSHPAVLQNQYMDVLASNKSAEALSPNMRAGVNRFRAAFLDPREREFWRDWEQGALTSVAQLRSAVGGDGDASPAWDLITELTAKSADFRSLWARQDVQTHAMSPVRLRHPRVGDLELQREKLVVAGADGIVLVVFHAEPGSVSAARLGDL